MQTAWTGFYHRSSNLSTCNVYFCTINKFTVCSSLYFRQCLKYTSTCDKWAFWPCEGLSECSVILLTHYSVIHQLLYRVSLLVSVLKEKVVFGMSGPSIKDDSFFSARCNIIYISRLSLIFWLVFPDSKFQNSQFWLFLDPLPLGER